MSGQKKGWGSVWSGAVAGLESRLDSILTEDNQASAKSRAAEAAAKQEAAAEKARLQVEQGPSRSASRNRPSSRLQDRLAKAVNKDGTRPSSRASSDFPSRSASPALGSPGLGSPALASPALIADTSRASIDSNRSEPVAEPTTHTIEKAETPIAEEPQAGEMPMVSTEGSQADAITATAASLAPSISIPDLQTPPTSTASPRQSLDSRPSFDLSAISTGEPDTNISRNPDMLQTELLTLQKTHGDTIREHREELHSHLERIDALQSKLNYLSQQLASQAKAAAAESKDATEKKLADKDAQIAALMEEGQSLSKTELKHLTAIKKMRAKAAETEKEITNLKQRLARAEKSIGDTTERAKRAEAAEKAAQEKLKIVARIEKDISALKAEHEEARLTNAELRRQLSDALSRAEDAEKRAQTGALEAEKRATAELRDDIENMRLEKKLAEDRHKRELQQVKEEATRQQERANVAEIELRGEIANLETKLELLRSRSEEVSSSSTGDSQAKLLRQIETLQTQYALASENWQGIESTLTSRVAALEKERDEIAKRENDIRRKARDVNSKSRRLEDELETINDRTRTLEQDLTEQQTHTQKLQARLAQAETAAQDARADLEREKKIWEADLQQRLEEEKNKWRLELQSHVPSSDSNYLRSDSPSASLRKHSGTSHSPDPLGFNSRRGISRVASTELTLSPLDRMLEANRPTSSRRSNQPIRTPEIAMTPHRQDSNHSIPSLNGGIPSTSQTPSIHTIDVDDFDNNSSPHRTINDMISVSTVGAGPSVQLVERMSAAVRRLESEKASSKEEMARLVAQRDEAREEVVALMREVEEKRGVQEKVEALEGELKGVDERYQTTLEMLGEKSEQVEELMGDVADLKKIYRDLVERTLK